MYYTLQIVTDAATPDASFPWEVVGNVGAAGVAVFCFVFSTRAMAEQRREFTAALKGLADEFADKVEQIADRVVESNSRTERTVADALRDRTVPIKEVS